MNKKSLSVLEFDKILSLLAELCDTENAKSLVMQKIPCDNIEDANDLLQYTIEADLICNRFNVYPIMGFDDVEELLLKSEKRIVLTFGELLRVARLLKCSAYYAQTIKNLDTDLLPKFYTFANHVYFDVELEKEINFKILSEDQMNDKASDRLYSLRKSIAKTNADIKAKLLKLSAGSEISKFLQDNLVTIRNGRYVVPVKTEYKNVISGLVHDMSASGSTVFIEPTSIVNLNNDLKMLQIAEQEEIAKIVADLCEKISAICGMLKGNLQILTDSDIVFAKSKFAKATDAVCPKLNNYGITDIIEARHPLIDRKKVVPVTISVGDGYNILTITGPNTGGKTVSLKIVGLFSLMAGFGMFLPCGENSRIAIYKDIFCDIGDEQSITQNLSSFSSHIVNLKNIFDGDISNSLLLFDELGAGTDPGEGSAIAMATLKFVLTTNARAVITTHYGEVKEFSISTDKIATSGMQFNPQTFEPTYKLIMGVASQSNALKIAKRLGLRREIVDGASQFLSNEKVEFEKILERAAESSFLAEKNLAEIEKQKQEFAQNLQKLESEKIKLEKEREFLQKNAKAEARRIVLQAQEESENIINELKFILNSDIIEEKDLFYARNLKKKLAKEREDEALFEEDTFATPLATFEVGKKVFVKKFGCNATISKLDMQNKKATVTAGAISSILSFDDLYETKAEAKEKKVATKSIDRLPVGSIPNELRLIGLNVLEALDILDKYLADAKLADLHEVKIIHGVGTGKLRAGIWEYLKGNKQVASYRKGKYGEGELGVTIIEL